MKLPVHPIIQISHRGFGNFSRIFRDASSPSMTGYQIPNRPTTKTTKKIEKRERKTSITVNTTVKENYHP